MQIRRFLGDLGTRYVPYTYNPEAEIQNIAGYFFSCELGSSVGIATDSGLDGPGSNPEGDEISARPDRPWGPPSLL